SRRIREASTERIMATCAVAGSITIAAGYFVIAGIPVDTPAIWDYGSRDSFLNLGVLGIISLVLFASFISFGIIISVILGRAGDGVGRLYSADRVGAGLGCLVPIPLISSLGPPAVIMVAAAVFALAGLAATPDRRWVTAKV